MRSVYPAEFRKADSCRIRSESVLFNSGRTVALVWLLVGLLSPAANAEPPSVPAQVDEAYFRKVIRPIFAAQCYECHGLAEQSGGLQLTSRETAFKPTESDAVVITPGQSANSPLFERISSSDESLRMPPEGPRLTSAEIAAIRKWIDAGAPWPEDNSEGRWAYLPPQRPLVPAVQAQDRVANPIDAFVLAKLERAGLTPSPPADRAQLLRRLSLDLIGLPPTPEELAAFLADMSPSAYEAAVDRLLASPRFGERWAVPWLDLARYADSNGFQADQLRDSWAYRDWVIHALNKDMPFDRFVVEQLAGDLLPDADIDDKIATGFHRTVTCNVEAGVHPEENRVNQVIDRVNTTATVFLGLTLECCQCHDHKYDPFTMRDYYGLFAYFNNTPLEVENPSGKGVSFDFYGPKMELPLPQKKSQRRKELQQQIARLHQQRDELQKSLAAEQPAWETEVLTALDNAPVWKPLEIVEFQSTGGETHRLLEDGSLLVTGKVPDTTTYTVTVRTDEPNITGFKIEALTHEELPGQGPGRGDASRPNFILSEFVVEQITAGTESPQRLLLHAAEADYSQANWAVSGAIDGDRKTGWAIGQEFAKSHWASFLTEKPLTAGQLREFRFTLDQHYGQGRTLGRMKFSVLTGDPTALAVPQNIADILRKPDRQEDKTVRTEDDARALAEFHQQQSPDYTTVQRKIEQTQTQLKAVQPDTTLVMVEMDKPRETHILQRGDYLNPGDVVEPGTPEKLHPLDADLPKNRLGLARWIVDRKNPLLARVTVNRWWLEIFGRGIVATPEDFGSQAEPPTHPELLDWLAVEFMENGWSMKRTLKQIVMSSTYRQSSRVTPELLAADPENKLLARGARFRMRAELVRDNALAISGLLSAKMDGPPVMPYQPDGLWRAVGRNAPKWKAAEDEDRFRRGVYIVWRRAAPYPSFVNFDAPDRAACVVDRSRTNTPLQALTLLNDPAYFEMALAFASRMATAAPKGDVTDRLTYGFRLAVARAPRPEELTLLKSLYTDRLAYYRQHEGEADKLVRAHVKYIDDSMRSELDTAALASWVFVANTLLNLDETVTRG